MQVLWSSRTDIFSIVEKKKKMSAKIGQQGVPCVRVSYILILQALSTHRTVRAVLWWVLGCAGERGGGGEWWCVCAEVVAVFLLPECLFGD